MEERGSMNENDMRSNGNEHNVRTSDSELDDSPPSTSSKRCPTCAATTASKQAKQPHAKRGAASRATAIDSQSPPSTMVVAAKPVWFTTASIMLRSMDGGTYWTRLLDVWSLFKAQAKYFDAKALPASQRPEAISEWMKRHRSQTWWPQPMKNFGKRFKVWWVSLQPKWRVTKEGVVSGFDGDFSPLKKSGPNGFLMVLVSLFYWHLDIKLQEDEKELEEDEEEWVSVVEDCISILELFLSK